ncbi:MAG: HD domain-containing phosphohydrolase [Anaerolineae bacterium]
MKLLLPILPDASQQLDAIFRAFPDFLLILDQDRIVRDYKGGEIALFFPETTEILNKPLEELFPAEIATQFSQSIQEARQSEGASQIEYFITHRKERRWFEARVVSLPYQQSAILIRDITKYKDAEEKAKRQVDRMAALRSIGLAITSSLDLKLTLSILLNQVINQLGVDAAAILLLDHHTRLLTYSASIGFRTSALHFTKLRLGEGYAGQAALERKTIHISGLNNHHTDFLRSPLFAQEGFVIYYAIPLLAKGQVLGVLEIFNRSFFQENEEWLDFMNMVAGQAAIAIDNALLFNRVERTNTELLMAYDATIEGWSRALDLRDKETEGHTQRVTEMTIVLARHMGISETDIRHIRRGAILHDIGKMAIPDAILFKPGPLSPEEWQIMRQHPNIAVNLLAPIPYLAAALDIPHYHHEKWDGSGYPTGLSGTHIPLPARLFAVVDAYDALTSNRPYRRAWSHQQALDYIRSQSGQHFDPAVVQIFLEMVGDFPPRPPSEAMESQSPQ